MCLDIYSVSCDMLDMYSGSGSEHALDRLGCYCYYLCCCSSHAGKGLGCVPEFRSAVTSLRWAIFGLVV